MSGKGSNRRPGSGYVGGYERIWASKIDEKIARIDETIRRCVARGVSFDDTYAHIENYFDVKISREDYDRE